MDSLIILFGKLDVLSCVPAQTMVFVRCIYSHFSVFEPLATLPVHAYVCVLEKLKCLKPLQPDSWGHRPQKSREKCQCC